MQPIHYLVLPSPYLAIYSHYLAPVVPKQGGGWGYNYIPPPQYFRFLQMLGRKFRLKA